MVIDRTHSLGIKTMPPGYNLLQLDSGHYIWERQSDHEESAIHWNKWEVWRWAWHDHNGHSNGVKHSRERRHPAPYYQGRTHRAAGHEKVVPATLLPVQRAWWLAGWHDADIEAQAAGR